MSDDLSDRVAELEKLVVSLGTTITMLASGQARLSQLIVEMVKGQNEFVRNLALTIQFPNEAARKEFMDSSARFNSVMEILQRRSKDNIARYDKLSPPPPPDQPFPDL
jgi:hypothetical protein